MVNHPSQIPDPLIQYLVCLDNMRCPDCWGYRAEAARYGAVGVFCRCPFDDEHP